MKRYIKMLSFLLVVCTFMISVNAYALNGNKVVVKDHVFTKAELACMTDNTLGTAVSSNEEFIEIKYIEGKTTRTSTTYYIIELEDGYMLTSPSSGAFSRTRYSNISTNNTRTWIFTEDNNGDYIVYSYTDTTKCLTVDPTTNAVSLSEYTGSEFQKWKMYRGANGNTLRTTSNDSRVKNFNLVINSTYCYVSSTNYTPVGFFDVSWYVPTVTISHPDFYLALDQTKTVTPVKNPTNAICANNWINWSNNYSKVTVNAAGSVTALSPGTDILTFTDKITRRTGRCTITVMPIANGTYFLKNKGTSDYAKVKDSTMTNGQNVVQYDLNEGNEFRWIFNLDTSTGYFSIRSANSTSPRYYMAVSDDSSELNKPVVIRSATETTLTDGMKWKVEATADGAYKIIPKTGETNGYVLASISSLGSNNKNLIQENYTDNSNYRDEWIIIDPSDYILMYIGYEDGAPEMPPIVNAVSTKLKNEAGMNGYGFTSLTENEVLTYLSSTTIFSCITHGLQDRIATTDGYITVSDINSLDSSAFNDLKFVYFGACETGKGGSGANNLVNAVYDKGADAVLGFKVDVITVEAYLWTEKFMIALAEGETLSSAMEIADSAVENDPDLQELPYYSTVAANRYLQGSDQMIVCP